MAQFRREAERGIRLMGPALLPVFEVGSSDGYHYMAMPYIEGTALGEVVRSRKAFMRGDEPHQDHWIVSIDEAEYLHAVTKALTKATHALSHVHELRIVHRDVKPANIMIDKNRPSGVYLCDFGLGRDLEVATAEQMRDGAGTPLYMSPERLRRDIADEVLCDIYSMGVTLFETTTLERPFRINDQLPCGAIPGYLAEAVPLRPRNIQADFPSGLEAIICKAMARDPSHRYQSASALAKDLERFLGMHAPKSRASASEHASATSVRGPHHSGGRPNRARWPARSADFESHFGCISIVPMLGRDCRSRMSEDGATAGERHQR
jgi:serine/threonine-protein kinase